jgi:hypothetical protein
MPGWPQQMTLGSMYSPCEGPIQVDIDGDGDLEVFAGCSDGNLYGWHHDGTYVTGFPINVNQPIQSSPAAGDIDGDGDLEVLIGNRNYFWMPDLGEVYAFHHDGTTVSGWPQQTLDGIGINSVALWDFDDDGDMEVFVASDRLYLWQGDGTLMPGLPVNFAGDQYGACSASSVGDIDGDGDAEIIVEGWDYLNAFHHDGTTVAGWPYALTGYFGFSYSAPSLVDVDNDGDVEIFCGAHESGGGSGNSNLYGIDGDGTDLPGFPAFVQGWTYSTPAIGDIDGDQQVEMALGCNYNMIYVFETNGSVTAGWPVYLGFGNIEAHMALADIDNDGQMEILFGNNGGTAGYVYYGYRGDGTPHPDFPFSVIGAALPSGSAIGDADLDGDLEIAYHTSEAMVYLWDAPYQAAGAAMPWVQPHHDVQHTGNYHFSLQPGDFTVDLTYVSGSPVPASGGNVYYEIFCENVGSTALDFDGWLDISYEGGNPVTLAQRFFSGFQPGWTINRPNMYLPVPSTYAAGNYLFYARAGDHPDEIWAEDSFPFAKSGDDEAIGFVPRVPHGLPDPFETVERDETKPIASGSMTAFPNPFNPATTLSYHLPQDGHVQVMIYDVSGRLVTDLVNGWRAAGRHEATWDGANQPSGLYLYRLIAGNRSCSGKMLLVK